MDVCEGVVNRKKKGILVNTPSPTPGTVDSSTKYDKRFFFVMDNMVYMGTVIIDNNT